MALLEIEDLHIALHNASGLLIIAKCNMSIHRGEIVGLIGESASGKSTIGRAVTSLLEPPAAIVGGRILFDGIALSHLTEKSLQGIRGKRIGAIFQNPFTALNPVLKIGVQMIEAILAHRSISRAMARKIAMDYLYQVEMPHPAIHLSQYPYELSGGQQQRIVIAIVLSCQPDLIVADEPSSALDAITKKKILALFSHLCRKNHIAVLLISHDIGLIARYTHRLYILQKGMIMETGDTKSVLASPQSCYTKTMLSCLASIDNAWPCLPSVSHIDMTDQKMLVLQQGMYSSWDKDKVILEVKSVSKQYQKSHSFLQKSHIFRAVSNVSFTMLPGKTLGVVGESASGKSTLGRMVSGLLAVSAGEIQYKGQVFNSVEKKVSIQNPLEVQCIFQNAFSSLNPRMKVGKALLEPLQVHQIVRKEEQKTMVIALLQRVGLSAAAFDKYPHQFSGGECQRIVIARALSVFPRFLFCDEPTSSLDMVTQAKILKLLQDLQYEFDLTLLFVSHDLAVLRQVSHSVAVMQHGQICEWGDVNQVFQEPQHSHTKKLLSSF